MNLRPLLFIPPVALGLAGFLWMTSRPAPAPEPTPERLLAVRVLPVEAQPITISVSGYGRVAADHSWSAISEVQGSIVQMPDGLDVGSIVEKDDLLLAVDTTDYELSKQKSQANIEVVKAQLAELQRQEENTRSLLSVERRILTVAQAELDRVQSLLERGTGTQAAVDTAQKNLFTQETSVTGLENTLALYPAQRSSLRANLALREAELQEVDRSLEKSRFRAPFRGRISDISVERGQFMRVGDNAMTLEATDAAEIIAEIQPRAFAALVMNAPDQIDNQQVFDIGQFSNIMAKQNVTATVSLSIGGNSYDWPAEIIRLRGTLDNDTGAMGIVVRVADPLRVGAGHRRPPLQSGSFVQVTLTARPDTPQISIPRHAVHLSDTGTPFVYLMDPDQRLAVRDVETGQVVGSNVLVRNGLSGGDQLILGDPRPPVPGMKLDPVTAAGNGL